MNKQHHSTQGSTRNWCCFCFKLMTFRCGAVRHTGHNASQVWSVQDQISSLRVLKRLTTWGNLSITANRNNKLSNPLQLLPSTHLLRQPSFPPWRFEWVLNHLLPWLVGNPGALAVLAGKTQSLVGWLTHSSFVNQASFPLIRRNTPAALVEPPQKHVTRWDKHVGLLISAILPLIYPAPNNTTHMFLFL